MASRNEQRLLYFGMFGPLSRLPLATLLDAGIAVAAVVVPARAAAAEVPPIRLLAPPPDQASQLPTFAALLRQTVIDLAWQRGIPVLEVAQLDHEAVCAALVSYRADLIAVSCFPYRFPPWLLALAPGGVLNLHPSLLPRGRGPDPLFWHFRDPDGMGDTGVTVHLMDHELDSGPIVAQERFPLTDGMSGQELELRAASLGAGLLAQATRSVLDGTARPRPQEEAAATTYPLPTAEDFVVTPERSARWAFNFLRGTAGGSYPHRIRVGRETWLVRSARGYDPDGTLSAPFVESADELKLRCSPGVLTVTTVAPRV